MKITWLGHSAFRIETAKAKILIDPFFTGNPAFDEATRKDAVAGLTHILLTHGHGDHVGDTVAIAKETGATVLANADLAAWLGSKGVEKLDMGNTGGTVHFDGFSATFVNALHSSAQITEDGVSPSVPGWTVLISLVAFTLIYAALAVVEIGLIIKTSKKGPEPLPGPDDPDPRERAVEDTPTTVY